MNRKLVVFGNGLGMALSAGKFSLKKVMPEVWEWKGSFTDEPFLSDKEKQLISDCIQGIEVKTGPSEESQMMGAQMAQFGHELITEVVAPDDQDHWFTEPAIQYPETISKYVYEVARQLDRNSRKFNDDPRLKAFLDGLIPFIAETKSHIATLNYDTLLYAPFNDGHSVGDKCFHVCKARPSETFLNDGYRKNGFQRSNFSREYSNWNFGFYLHLHGSPLFVDEDDKPKKLKRSEISGHTPNSAHHIILSDGSLKKYLIERSPVLSLYWDMLDKALEEASEIIVFGYGGGDDHLNKAIKDSGLPVRIVEYNDPKATDQERETYWAEKLSKNGGVIEGEEKQVTLVRLDSILDFSDWSAAPDDDYIPF